MKRKSVLYLLAFLVLLILTACKDKPKKEVEEPKRAIKPEILNSYLKKENFNASIDGKVVQLYWLQNKGLTLAMTNYGGRILSLFVPDKNGQAVDVSIARGTLQDYLDNAEAYFGATIGRVGNRIAKGKFALDGILYTIPTNNNENTLHGGPNGFQGVVWGAAQPNAHTLVLRYTAADMEEGFPGKLKVKVTYSLTDTNALKIEYEATTDKPTVINLTNHTYFNLNGEGTGTILNHEMKVNADKFTPVDAGLIPTGELKDVRGTPFDFTTAHTIGERIDDENQQLSFGGGYDHNYALNKKETEALSHAATVIGDKSHIVMDVYTKEPGLQFYSGNFMASENLLKSGAKDDYRTAFCLETQHYPDAPNQSNFPSIRLNPGEIYKTVTEYRFSTK